MSSFFFLGGGGRGVWVSKETSIFARFHDEVLYGVSYVSYCNLLKINSDCKVLFLFLHLSETFLYPYSYFDV